MLAEVDARLEQGLPVLSPEVLAVDGEALGELCDEIVSILAERRPEQADAFAAVRAWLARERERLGTRAMEYLREGHIGEGDEADLLAFIFDTALHPFLRAAALPLAPAGRSHLVSRRLSCLWRRARLRGHRPPGRTTAAVLPALRYRVDVPARGLPVL